MCFVLGVSLGAVAKINAPLLSSNTVEWRSPRFYNSNFIFILISLNNCCMGIISLIAVDSAMYSASSVDNAISDCNLEDQFTGHPAIVNTYPVLDLTHTGS